MNFKMKEIMINNKTMFLKDGYLVHNPLCDIELLDEKERIKRKWI